MGGEINFTDKFYNAIESIWMRNRNEVTYRILDLEKNEEIDNNLNITDIDVAEEGFNWNVKMNNSKTWTSMKIGRVLRSLFGMDTFSHAQVNEFIRQYHRTVGLDDNGDKIEGTTPITPDKAAPAPAKKTTTYSGGSTSRYSEYDDEWGEYYGGYTSTSRSNTNDLQSKYGYSRGGNYYGYQQPKKLGTKIEVPKFKYDPTNVYTTFLSLVTKTYPHFAGNPHEKEVLQFLPPLESDKHGNYFKVIGESDTMFTCHLDTADREQKETKLYSYTEGQDTIIQTDGSSILGADDKAGVAVMLYMMAHKIPGIYYFFIGEERGGIGSRAVAGDWQSFGNLHHVRKCISFDRRNYHSVITAQGSRTCCSNEFGTDLAQKLSDGSGLKMSLDSGGVWTDSAAFIELIGECTNISVGYFSEHTGNEIQNITFLDKLAKACVKVDWENLVIKRNIGFDNAVLKKYQPFLQDMRAATIACSNKLIGEKDCIYYRIEFDEPMQEIHHDLMTISVLMNKHKMDPDIVFEDEYLKIELK